MTECIAYREFPRIAADRLNQLKGLSVADIHDALPQHVKRSGLMHHLMRPINPGLSFVGQALTVLSAPGDNLMMHLGLSLAGPGDVLVVSNGGVAQGALWGEHAATDAMTQGLAGIVIDGPCRDTTALRRIGAPVWATSISVTSPGKQGPGAVNVPVSCAGVNVEPGDIVAGDEDSIVVFHEKHIEAVAETVRARMEREAIVRQKIRSGERLFNLSGIDSVVEQQGIRIRSGDWRETGGT